MHYLGHNQGCHLRLSSVYLRKFSSFLFKLIGYFILLQATVLIIFTEVLFFCTGVGRFSAPANVWNSDLHIDLSNDASFDTNTILEFQFLFYRLIILLFSLEILAYPSPLGCSTSVSNCAYSWSIDVYSGPSKYSPLIYTLPWCIYERSIYKKKALLLTLPSKLNKDASPSEFLLVT